MSVLYGMCLLSLVGGIPFRLYCCWCMFVFTHVFILTCTSIDSLIVVVVVSISIHAKVIVTTDLL